MPSLNEIRESLLELSCTQVKTYGDGMTNMKPIYSRLSSGDITKYNHILKSFKVYCGIKGLITRERSHRSYIKSLTKKLCEVKRLTNAVGYTMDFSTHPDCVILDVICAYYQ